MIRFVGAFLALLLAFQFVYYELIVDSGPFRAYVAATGRVAAALLLLAGERVAASGSQLTSSFTMSIRSGCDGLQAMAILVIAVVAFPGAGAKKLLGVIGGVALLFVLNLLRIASLFWTGARAPWLFQTMHVHLWPAAIVLSAVLLWVVWAKWCLRTSYAS